MGDPDMRFVKTHYVNSTTITPGKVYRAAPSIYKLLRILNDEGEEIVITLNVPSPHLDNKGSFFECDEKGSPKRLMK